MSKIDAILMKNPILLFLILLFLILVTAISCTSKKTTDIDWTPITTSLTSEALIVDTALFNGINAPMMYNNIVISNQQQNSKHLHACRITKDSIISIGEFLSVGNGPYEMHIPRFYWNFKEQYLTVCDYLNRQNKIIYIPLDSLQNIFHMNRWEVAKFTPFKIKNNIIYLNYLAPIEKDKFITNTPFGADKMFALIDNINDTVTLFDFDYPEDGCRIKSTADRPYAYEGLFRKHPEENKFVYFSFVNRYMLITEYQNGAMKEIASPYKLYPKYYMKKEDSNVHYNGECYMGAINIYPTSRYIYVLMNDMTWEDDRNHKLRDGYSCFYSNEIYVFNWNGDPVKKYLLDYQVGVIWVDENDQNLYATTLDLKDIDQGTLFLRYPIK